MVLFSFLETWLHGFFRSYIARHVRGHQGRRVKLFSDELETRCSPQTIRVIEERNEILGRTIGHFTHLPPFRKNTTCESAAFP